MLRTGAQFYSKFSGCSAQEGDFGRTTITMKFQGCSARKRNFIQNFQDASHGSAILDEKRLNFEDAPHGSAIFLNIFRMLRTGERLYSICSACSARERYFPKIFRMLRTGGRFFSKSSGCSARERDFERRSRETYIPKLYRSAPLNTALLKYRIPPHHLS